VALRARRPSANPDEEARSHVQLAKAASLAGQDEVAEQHLREALRVQPRDRIALFNLAVVLLKRDRPAEALPLLDVVLREAPAHPTAHLARGQARANEALGPDVGRRHRRPISLVLDVDAALVMREHERARVDRERDGRVEVLAEAQ